MLGLSSAELSEPLRLYRVTLLTELCVPNWPYYWPPLDLPVSCMQWMSAHAIFNCKCVCILYFSFEWIYMNAIRCWTVYFIMFLLYITRYSALLWTLCSFEKYFETYYCIAQYLICRRKFNNFACIVTQSFVKFFNLRILIKFCLQWVKKTSILLVSGLYMYNKSSSTRILCISRYFYTGLYIILHFFLYDTAPPPRDTQLPLQDECKTW